ncbi:ComEC/Rec2 family competence protein [Amycolatopsis taiwanensis]|uniref:ComEC/Rec2 family competence protein n=1 Tax=Amycolatopsis taiwanensis TaxID=342230 RepID=UPI000485F88B|nr:ComEC/Rec2 family competence protein [Amycolatopsis taiwanensis]
MTTREITAARQDFRLVPAALSLWLGALAGLLFGWWAALAGGIVTMLAASFLLWRRPAGSSAGGSGWVARFRGNRWRSGLFGALLAGLVLAGPLTIRMFRAEHDPLRELAARGTSVTLRVVVAGRPKPVHSAGYADQPSSARLVVVTADVLQAEAAGGGGRVTVGSGGRVVLIAPFQQWSDLLPGQEVTSEGKLAPPRGADLTVAAVYVRGPPVNPGSAPWWQRAAESLRGGLRQASSGLSADAAGLLPGLVAGDISGLSPQVQREFTAAGMSHLMAVSGSQFAIVAGVVLLLLRILRLGPRLSALLTGLALTGFVVFVGAEPSVLRAAVMGGVGLLAMALGRRRSALPALAIAVCVLVVFDPATAVSFGFTLSVLATGGLVLLAPRWAGALIRRGVPAGFADGLAIPVAAFVVTAPVIAGMAGAISVVSIVANILAAPVVAPATVLGVVAAMLSTFWPAAAGWSAWLAGPEADWLVLLARHASRAPGAVLSWPSGWWGGFLALVAVGVLVLALHHRRLRVGLAVVLVCVLLAVVPVQVIAPAWPPAHWSFVACDVGQGDAAVLATADPGRAVVVDTGPEPGPADECLTRLGVDRVPLLVLSHLHADHIGGLDSVLAGRSVGAVAVGPGRMPGWAWRQVAEVTTRRGVPLLELAPGQRLDWPGLSVQVLGPREVSTRQLDDTDGTVINNASVVLKAVTAAGRVLLPGDVEFDAQGELLAADTDLHAEVLKVPHHGSRYSLPGFFAAVAPRIAVISVGAGNRYGHPSKSTVDTLTADGALVARTDSGGDTAVVADAQGPEVVRRGG